MAGTKKRSTTGTVTLTSPSAGTWITYTTSNSGLNSNGTTVLAAGATGVIWVANRSGGVNTYDPTTAVWTIYATGGGLPEYRVLNDQALVPATGEVWVATDTGASRYCGPHSTSRVLWQNNAPITLDGGQTFALHDNLETAALDARGKLYLRGRLQAATGQVLAQSEPPFYIFDDSLYLTLELLPGVLQPGQPVLLSGKILYLDEGEGYEGVTLTVTLDGEATVISDALSLLYGETVPYTLTRSAPAARANYSVTAALELSEDYVITVTDWLRVATPEIDLTLAAPEVAGRAPFTTALTVENPSPWIWRSPSRCLVSLLSCSRCRRASSGRACRG